MATQFISAFIVIGLLVFLGVVAAIGVTNAKTKQAALCEPQERRLDSGE
ncbi:MAG: hypothetical protein ACO1NO_00450 [Burkholderiaceae bacterium]